MSFMATEFIVYIKENCYKNTKYSILPTENDIESINTAINSNRVQNPVRVLFLKKQITLLL